MAKYPDTTDSLMEILFYQAAKELFDSLDLQKLTSMESLRREHAVNDAKWKKLYRNTNQRVTR